MSGPLASALGWSVSALFGAARPSGFELDGLPGGWGVAVKALLPWVVFLVFAPVFYALFRKTWREFDDEAAEYKAALRKEGKVDYRPAVLFAIVALVLTMQEYYGGRSFYYHELRPLLREIEAAQLLEPGGLGRYVNLGRYDELYGYAWWALTRVTGYVVVPLAFWKLIFRRDRLRDAFGLRSSGLLRHAWLYGLGLLIVLPPVFLVSLSSEFSSYYPFYKKCSRSWFDLLAWESMYIAQFLALEIFFRGFMVSALRRTMGSAAIFVMCVPYVMIHYGKPYHEACGAMIAGIFLGTLAMRSRSILWGFLLHITVALFMDGSAMLQARGFPTTFWPAR